MKDEDLADLVTGVFLGALAGGGLGLGACVYVIEGALLFTGDTVLLGAVAGGALGPIYGEPFIDWLSENWWWFW